MISAVQSTIIGRIVGRFYVNLFAVVLCTMFSVAVSAQNYTVNSNGDTHAVTPTSSPLDGGGQITLRSACEAATQIAGTHIITIPGSITTINLSLGQITIGNAGVGNNITINGAGKAVLTINQTTVNRIFFTGAGAITFSLNDLTLNYVGPVGSFGGGGGAIIAGGINANTSLTNVAINNFNIQSGNGGALLCSTANTNNVTLTNCDFNNNTAGGGGGAVSIVTNSTANITNCKFTNNKTGTVGASVGGSGGALLTSGTGNGGTYTVTNCRFTNNQTTNPTPQTGGACFNTNGTLNLSFCRFVGNTITGGGAGQTLGQAGGATVNAIVAQNNWWGVNTGPTASDVVVLAAGGTITVTKWLQLKTSIAVNPLCSGSSTTVTASFLSNSAAEAVTNSNVSTLIGQPISFVNPTLGSLSGAQATIQNSGTATVTFTAGATAGTGSVNAVVDNIPGNDVAPAKVSFSINGGATVTGNPSNTAVCSGANASFTASFSGTPTPTIQWQVSTNGGANYNNIPGATSSPLVFATSGANNGNLYRAVGTNLCVAATTTGALLTVNTLPFVTGNPSNTSVPAGSNASFSASFGGSPTPSLQWQVSTNGGGIYNNIAGATSSPLVFTTNLSQSGNLYRAVGTNLCSSINTTGALLTVTNACATSSVISVSGTSSICAGQQANIKVSITGGASPFTLVYNNGTGNITVPGYISGSNIPVLPATTTSYTIVSVTDANLCVGSGNSGTATITVSPVNAGITNNSGSTVLTCLLTSISVTATGTGGSSYQWDGGTSPNTAANSFSSPGTYHVLVTSAGGCTGTAQITITQNIVTPATPGPLTGIKNVCPFVATGTQLTYSVPSTTGTTYNWIIPPSATLITGQGTNSIVITLSAAFASSANKQLRVTATNSCGSSQLAVFYLVAQAPGTPQAIQYTSLNACPIIGTASTHTYKIPKVPGAVSYLWTAQAGTTNIIHPNGAGVNDTIVNVSFAVGFTSSALTVRSVNDCGIVNISSPRSVTILANAASTPSPISGPTNACAYTAPNGSVATYSVTAETGIVYNWTIPATATNVSGQGTASISFRYTVSFTGGTLSVVATNGCGTSSPRSIAVSKLNAATPGVIDIIQVSECPNRVFTFSIANTPTNATSVQWTVPLGSTILSGQGTNSISVSLPPTAINSQVTAQGVSNCSNSVLRVAQVKLPACPPSIAGRSSVSGHPFQLSPETVSVNVYPNPSSQAFNLQVNTRNPGKVQVTVTDMGGRALKQFSFNPSQAQQFGAELKAGVYMISIRQGDIVQTQRVVKM